MRVAKTVSADSDRIIRGLVMIVMPVFVIQILLVMYGELRSPNYSQPEIAVVLIGTWIVLSAYHYFRPLKSSRDILGRFIAFEALALVTIMIVTGFFQPFIAALLLLFVAAEHYFGDRGFIASVLGVVIAAGLDTIIRAPSQPEIIQQNLMATVAVLTLAIILQSILDSQKTRRSALARSRRQERLQYDRISTIMNNMTDATFSTDSKGTIQLYNAACLNLLDTNRDLKGVAISELFELTNGDGKKIRLNSLLKKAHRTTYRDDLRHTYPDGEIIRLEITYAPIKSTYGTKGRTTENGYVVIARDITKMKSLEEERDEFISVVSHELRTPITIAEGTLSNLQLIVERSDKMDKKVAASTIKTAHDQIVYLAKMVNDLSTLSRAERGVADTQEDIDVSEMIHHLHRQYQSEAAAKNLKLDLDMPTKPGQVHASRLYLEELLQNFITNAIKYTNEGTIRVVARRHDGKVRFDVTDTGIGISRSDQEKIFNKFYRSEDYRIRETGGTGLGLYVSSKLARKLGTKIEVTSRLNHGSTFSFELPLID